jgi:hypothetical protein
MDLQVSDGLGELLDRQCGVLARWQIAPMTLDLDVATAQLRSGRWQRLQLGVYAAFTGPASRDAELWAAVLRCGPHAGLSHQTAADLDGFASRASRLIHVSVPLAQHMAHVPGLAVHRSSRLDVARHPVRTPSRTRVEETALDLAQLATTFDDAFGWISRACSGRLTRPELVLRATQSRGKVRWRAELAIALGDIAEGVHSPLEHRYVRNVERPHALPRGKRQVLIKRGSRHQYLDNLYEEFGIGVELDGQAYHPAEARWQDIGRDNALAADGLLILRYGWADVSDRACQVAAQIAAAAGHRGWAGPLRRCGRDCVAPRYSQSLRRKTT